MEATGRFYAQPSADTFRTPDQAIEPKLAESVYMLAWRASTTLEFLLKAENLERYVNAARSIRAKMTEADQQRISEIAGEMAEQLFPASGEGSETDQKTLH